MKQKIGKYAIDLCIPNITYTKHPKWMTMYVVQVIKTNKNNTQSIIFNSLNYLVNNKKNLRNLGTGVMAAFLYWGINLITNNWLSIALMNSLLNQIFMVFLTVTTILNLFTPTGFNDSGSEQKIKDTIKDEIPNIIKEIERENRKINSFK